MMLHFTQQKLIGCWVTIDYNVIFTSQQILPLVGLFLILASLRAGRDPRIIVETVNSLNYLGTFGTFREPIQMKWEDFMGKMTLEQLMLKD